MARTGKTDEEILVEAGRENVEAKTKRRDGLAGKLKTAIEKHAIAKTKHDEAIDTHVEDPTDSNEKRAHAAASTALLLDGHVRKAQREHEAAETDLRAAQSDLATAEQNLADANRRRRIEALLAVLATLESRVAPFFAALFDAYEKMLAAAGAIEGAMSETVNARAELVTMGETAPDIRWELLLKPIAMRLMSTRPGLAVGVLRALTESPAAHLFTPHPPQRPVGTTFLAAIRNAALDGAWVHGWSSSSPSPEHTAAAVDDLAKFFDAPTRSAAFEAVKTRQAQREAAALAALPPTPAPRIWSLAKGDYK